MKNAKVAIELYVDDKGTVRIKQFAADSEESFKKVEHAGTSAADRIRGAWIKLKGAWVAVMAAIMSVQQAWNMMNAAAKARQERRSFAALAASYGSSAKQIVASLKEVSQGTVDTMTLIRNAGTAMMMGIKPEDTVALMKIATATAKMTGQTTVKAFEDITLAVARQSKMILDNLGIIIDTEKANATYAEKLGIVGRALTDAEKKQAFMNATLAAGTELTEKMGNQSGTASDKFERFAASIQNVKTAIGDVFIRVFNLAEGVLYKLGSAIWVPIAAFYTLVQGVGLLTDSLRITTGAADLWGQRSKEAFATFNEMSDKGGQAFRDMISTNDAMIEGQGNYTKKIQETTKAIEEQEKAEKKILALHKKEEAQKVSDTKEMYEQLGQGGEAYFSAEASELVKKAAKWKEAGADTLAVEEWLYDQLGLLSDQAWEKQETAAGQAMDNLQAQTSAIVDEVDTVLQTGMQALQQYGLEIEGLDGSAFTVYAALDGSGMISTVESLIAKFQQLHTVAASAPSPGGGSTGPAPAESAGGKESMDEWVDRIDNAPDNYNTTININQKMSRSDVNNVIAEQSRQEERN